MPATDTSSSPLPLPSGVNGQLYDVSIYNAERPIEGPRAVALTLPFSAATDYDVNMLLTQGQMNITLIQAIWFDNTQNNSDVILTVKPGLYQKVRLPANATGYLSLLCPKNAQIQAHSTGGVDIPVIFINVPVANVVYYPQTDNEAVNVAASTTQALGAKPSVGDFVDYVLIVPLTTSPGAVSLQDGAGTTYTLFAGGATSVGSLVPFTVPFAVSSETGGWTLTTGADVQAIVFGQFTG